MGEASTIHSSPTPLTPAGAPTNGFSALMVVGTRQGEKNNVISTKIELIILNESRK
jgi:hypothetical protein